MPAGRALRDDAAMIDFAVARTRMVDNQLRTEDVTDYDVLAAMGALPRERFVPKTAEALAYIDEDILLAPADGAAPPRYLMEPARLAKLVQLADVGANETVLDIGCGTGYSTAVFARLAKSVIGLESNPALAAEAARNLSALGAANATVVTGPLEAGHPAAAPYDVILLGGAIEVVPDTLFDQLTDGGRLVAVVGYGMAAVAMLFTRTEGKVGGRPAFNMDIRPLPGFRRPRAFVF